MENAGLMFALAGAMTKGPTNAQVASAVDDWLTDHPEATTTVQDGAVTEAKLASVLSNKLAKSGVIAADYSSSNTYKVGDYVWYNGALYCCTTAITTAEAWTAGHWSAAVIGNDVEKAKEAVEAVEAVLPQDVVTIDVGENFRGYWKYNNGGAAEKIESSTGSYYARNPLEIPEGVKVTVKNSRYYNSNNSRPVMVVDAEYNILLALTNDGTLSVSEYEFVTPAGSKYLLLTQYQSSYTQNVSYSGGYKQIASEAYVAAYTTKKPYVSGNIFFSVDCPRPIPFGEDSYTAQTDETVECVLRLPSTYTPTGKPTRLVLACHGASGYIDSANDVWYNSNWISFMNALTSAGYAVFDANIFGGNNTDIIGFALGSPLYVQALKLAYDYIQDNYNVYPQIFAHGTSMGGVGAKAFTHIYPELVLAQSSFAGRDICKYLHTMKLNEYTCPYSGKFSVAYGYANDAALLADKFSHCMGVSDSLGILKIVDGAVVYPPDRNTDFHGWIDYYSAINTNKKTSPVGEWIGHSPVPYKSWNEWDDDANDAAQELVMRNAYAKTNSAPYYVVLYDEGYTHTNMSYGQVEDMRDQLITWFKRWE